MNNLFNNASQDIRAKSQDKKAKNRLIYRIVLTRPDYLVPFYWIFSPGCYFLDSWFLTLNSH
jgi:hypothetical protein